MSQKSLSPDDLRSVFERCTRSVSRRMVGLPAFGPLLREDLLGDPLVLATIPGEPGRAIGDAERYVIENVALQLHDMTTRSWTDAVGGAAAAPTPGALTLMEETVAPVSHEECHQLAADIERISGGMSHSLARMYADVLAAAQCTPRGDAAAVCPFTARAILSAVGVAWSKAMPQGAGLAMVLQHWKPWLAPRIIDAQRRVEQRLVSCLVTAAETDSA
ncbi:hypothetical protein IP84_08455 [beta proteobacterium AAP99]|nr:hypothetical protein IP84_08455 [beta proteobacterium AAP99]